MERTGNTVSSASLSELQGLYTEYFIDTKNKDSTDSRDPKLLEKVMFPMHPSTSLRNNEGTLEFITDFDFRDGAHFLRDSKLSLKQRCDVINLLAKLVTFRSDESAPKFAAVLPAMIVKFAQGSRIDSGERLLRRCIRHSLDTKTPSILCAHGSVFQHRGVVGFAIRHQISPSFKDGMYSVASAFTAASFLAAECDCKAGPECT